MLRKCLIRKAVSTCRLLALRNGVSRVGCLLYAMVSLALRNGVSLPNGVSTQEYFSPR